MTPDKARGLLQVQVTMGGGCHRIRNQLHESHGQAGVDRFVEALGLAAVFGLRPGTHFSKVV